jgi:hypothetical protein
MEIGRRVEYLEELHQGHLVHNKSYMTRTSVEPSLPQWEAGA